MIPTLTCSSDILRMASELPDVDVFSPFSRSVLVCLQARQAAATCGVLFRTLLSFLLYTIFFRHINKWGDIEISIHYILKTV